MVGTVIKKQSNRYKERTRTVVKKKSDCYGTDGIFDHHYRIDQHVFVTSES